MDDVALHRFEGDLILRLLELGHAVGPTGALQLSVHTGGDAIAVACRLGGTEHRVEIAPADAATLGLELAHRALQLVERCAGEGGAAGELPRDAVVLDVDELSADDVSELALGLVEHEVTVVGDASLASARLCAAGASLDAGVFVIEVERSCAS